MRCAECGHVFEQLVYPDDYTLKRCPVCLNTAASRVIIAPPRIGLLQMGSRPDASDQAIDHFERVHRQQKIIEEKCEQEHGDYGPRPGAD